MEIKEYIKQREFNTAVMAKDLKCSISHLRALMNKKVRASYPLAKLIESYTKGKIKADDIMTWELKKKPSKKVEG
jgi:predicted XRE-type DNA-binding protein